MHKSVFLFLQLGTKKLRLNVHGYLLQMGEIIPAKGQTCQSIFWSYHIYAIFLWAVVESGKDMSCVIDLKAF